MSLPVIHNPFGRRYSNDPRDWPIVDGIPGEVGCPDDEESGFVTAEYAVGIIAAVAFAGVLLAVVKSGAIRTALSQIIQSALSV